MALLTGSNDSRLVLSGAQRTEMVAHCLRCFPEEGCGLIVGEPRTGFVTSCIATENTAHSASLYTVNPRDLLQTDREAERLGLEIIGVFHSHTHTDPYPSPTDVDQAPDPSWHYVLISLRYEVASVRSYRIKDRAIFEEPIFESL